MGGNLQLPVAFNKQLTRAMLVASVQPVVAQKERARADFAKRLNEALDEHVDAAAGRQRRAWVATRFGVSVEAARKWLVGESTPDTARLSEIATELGVNVDWLLTGRQPKRQGDARPARASISPEAAALIREIDTRARTGALAKDDVALLRGMLSKLSKPPARKPK